MSVRHTYKYTHKDISGTVKAENAKQARRWAWLILGTERHSILDIKVSRDKKIVGA